jgi:hypothetical protein
MLAGWGMRLANEMGPAVTRWNNGDVAMRRWNSALLLAVSLLAVGWLVLPPAAEAGWGHRHGGWGHRHCGYGWGGGWYGGGISVGYCGPRYNYSNYCPPSYCWPSWGGGYNYGCSPTVGYYTGGAYHNYTGGAYYNPSANFALYNLPATYQPAELAYGPLAVKQFLGLDRNFALGPLREPPVRLPLIGGGVAGRELALDRGEIKAARPVVRISSIESRRKAERYLAEGDTLFRAQKFHSALQKYKLASNSAPDVAETYWRQGHAMIATSNFSLAAGVFKRAIALSDDIGRADFTLDHLYGAAGAAKIVHIEQLAAHALEHSDTSDPYFLIGVTLAYDGQRERAGKFFERAADLAGGSGGHIAAFRDGIEAPIVAAADESPIPPAAAKRPVAPIVPVSVGTEI